MKHRVQIESRGEFKFDDTGLCDEFNNVGTNVPGGQLARVSLERQVT